MHGELANKLVAHAKRTRTLASLPPYSTELVRAIAREVRDLDRHVAHTLAPYAGAFTPAADPATACALLVAHLSMRRNKRCLLAYHRVRAEKLEALAWEGRDVEDARAPGPDAPDDGPADRTGRAHDDVLNLLGLDAGALERRLDGNAAELGGLERREAAAELADRGAGAAENHCLGHDGDESSGS